MKRLIIFCILCQVWTAYGIEKQDGTYLIATAQDLCDFALLVNGGKPDAAARLTADIDMTGLDYVPIGTSAVPYQGRFDGQGFTIDNVVFPTGNNAEGQGLFGYVGAAEIRGVRAGKSNRIYGGAFTGGLVGDKVGSGICTIDCCGHEGQVKGSAQNAAAFVGCVHSGSLIITNCYNTGSVTGGRESAIFCGWFGGSQSSISNCYNSGTLKAGADGSNYLWRSAPTHANIYDTSGRQSTTRFTSTWRTSGMLCWKLNGNKPDGAFRQNLTMGEKDDHPVPFSNGHAQVFANGLLKCDGTPADGTTATFSNTDDAIYEPHRFVDGLCDVCNQVDAEYMYADAEGYYQLATPQALRWFAYFVNSDEANTRLCARLTDHINMSGISYPGIGTMEHPFAGEIDGGRFVISHLVMKRTGDTGVGLVNVGTDELDIHDLTLDATCSFTGYRYVGGFAGQVSGANGGVAFFRCLGFEGTINVNDNGGGIVGCVPNNDFQTYFSSCYTTGTVNGVSDNGALSGWSSYARLEDCYAVVRGKGFEGGSDVVRGFSPRFINCYAKDQQQAGLTTFTDTQMRDGTLLRWLRSDAYQQQIGTDTHPLIGPDMQTELFAPASEGQEHDHSHLSLFDLMGRRITDSPRSIIVVQDGKKWLNVPRR